ncbi:hypothetical protein J5X84_12435 [Streptosporangiaceae bacterium NEAU-GS5]|nr:hypothetical protein [Streptosporangiaceae bacterium NEAU-GS5]
MEQAEAFAAYFRSWGLTLPAEAIERRSDGTLYGRGWSVRWRWLPDGGLEFHACHRMTNDRWQILYPDGHVEQGPVAPEMFAAEEPGARQRYRAAWRDYTATLDARDLHPRPLDDAPSWNPETTLLWTLDPTPETSDDSASAPISWRLSPLPPRPDLPT